MPASIVGKGHRAGYKQQHKNALNAKLSAAAAKEKKNRHLIEGPMS